MGVFQKEPDLLVERILVWGKILIGFIFGGLLVFASSDELSLNEIKSAGLVRGGILLLVVLRVLIGLLETRIKKSSQDQRSPQERIGYLRILIELFLLVWLVHIFGGLNGPLFLLLILPILEAAVFFDAFFVHLVCLLICSLTSMEFVLLVTNNLIEFSLLALAYFIFRLAGLGIAAIFALKLVQKRADEQMANDRAQRSEERLKSVTKNLKVISAKLQELSKLKDEFVSVASHELRAPMTTIKGYISMIMEGDAGLVSPKVKEYLRSAYDSSERMIRLVNNMLNVSRIESGRLIMSLDDIQIEEAITEVVRSFSLEAESHGLELKYFSPPKKLPKVRVDPDRIREVIANLIGNAINFTSHGHIHVRSKLDEDNIVISVEDTGVGISPNDQRELFKKFSQVGMGAPLKKGSGLGLYICKMLINDFGGEIWLKSKTGKGTTFFFSLPAIKSYNYKEMY